VSAARYGVVAATALAVTLGSSGGMTAPRQTACPPEDTSITLPPDFCATVFADLVGMARHIAVGKSGALFVAIGTVTGGSVTHIGRLRPDRGAGAILVLRDTSGDGHADLETRVPFPAGTGLTIANGYLYAVTRATVQRFRLDTAETAIVGPPDTLVMGMAEDIGHLDHSVAVDDAGNLFVSMGSASNACRRRRGDTAPDPCPELAYRSGIWRFSATRLRQVHPQDGERFATGIRNALAMSWSAQWRGLYSLSHGRDGLLQNFPQYYDARASAELPSEEFARIERGDDWGWPYCYHDRMQQKKVLAPEYGGNGRTVGRCASAREPLIGFPGHWAPNALLLYRGTQFPPRYRGGAFVAFHGSWNRLPLAEEGYRVVFAPLAGGRPSGAFETFADGFAGDTLEPVLARQRPTGLAEAPDGALFISDDMRGRIWRVRYRGPP
jgi:glucose/arabinose dehydrogenase